MNDVFPVLFSPTKSVSGAKRTVCTSRKQRKLLNEISSITLVVQLDYMVVA